MNRQCRDNSSYSGIQYVSLNAARFKLIDQHLCDLASVLQGVTRALIRRNRSSNLALTSHSGRQRSRGKSDRHDGQTTNPVSSE